jgi:predicted nucleotidyltransferase
VGHFFCVHSPYVYGSIQAFTPAKVESHLGVLFEFVYNRGVEITIQDQIAKIVQERLPNSEAIYLFGSFATADERPDSDIDIAVSGKIDPLDLQRCRIALEAAFNRDVHLIHLNTAQTILQKEIVTNGRLLWAKSALDSERFALYILASYQKLSSERRAIIEEGRESGRFYQP